MALAQLITSLLLMHSDLNLDPVTCNKVWQQVSINLTLGVRGVETGGFLEFISGQSTAVVSSMSSGRPCLKS